MVQSNEIDFRPVHFVIAGEDCSAMQCALRCAHLGHYPSFEISSVNRTRISIVVSSFSQIHDFVFEYKELFDNSYWRIVNLTEKTPQIELHRPQYEGKRRDFVDVEWEFVVGWFSHPILQEKLSRWANGKRRLTLILCFDDAKNESYAEKLRRRLSSGVRVKTFNLNRDGDAESDAELLEMAKYLHYFYQASYELKHVPTELPLAEVDKAWNEIADEKLRMSNLYNVMSIPVKMQILGHDRSDWAEFYALTAEEIELLTAIEHNRWCVERLLQGMRPCTDSEREAVAEDMRLRLADSEYAVAHPVSLKKRYKDERCAHYDLCANSELGVDESGLPVSRYDRDLTAAIPLIVKTFHDHYGDK